VHDNVDDSILLTPGNQFGRLEALDVNMLNEISPFEASLTITPVLEIDLNSHVYLEVVNDVGSTNFDLKLKIKEDPIDEPPVVVPVPGSGPDAGVIVGISLACLIFISVLVGFTIWYCKKYQFLCFAQSR